MEGETTVSVDFGIGDMVVLKSGGPRMTIFKMDSDRTLAECIYFPKTDGGQYSKDAIGAAFPVASLQKTS